MAARTPAPTTPAKSPSAGLQRGSKPRRLRLTSMKAVWPRGGRVSVRHLPKDAIARIDHRVGVVERCNGLMWRTLVYELKKDVERAAPDMTEDERGAVVEWLRWKEYERRYATPETVVADRLASCRRMLGDVEALAPGYWRRPSRSEESAPASDAGGEPVTVTGEVKADLRKIGRDLRDVVSRISRRLGRQLETAVICASSPEEALRIVRLARDLLDILMRRAEADAWLRRQLEGLGKEEQR